MFRAVSHQLYAKEEFHLILHSVVQEVLECNVHHYPWEMIPSQDMCKLLYSQKYGVFK